MGSRTETEDEGNFSDRRVSKAAGWAGGGGGEGEGGRQSGAKDRLYLQTLRKLCFTRSRLP